MLKFRKTLGAVLAAGAMLAALSACQQEGPAERAGKQADKAMGKVGQQIEKAGESIQDAAKGEQKK